MKKYIFILFCVLLLISYLVPCCYPVKWTPVKGEHFIVYYTQDKGFAHDVLKASERYYKRIAKDLGYQRHQKFWLWDQRVKIYIYSNQSEFMKETDNPPWIHGMAYYKEKKIVSYNASGLFINSILPHEIAHLIFRDYVGFKSDIPLWIDEGVAMWEEEDKREASLAKVRLAIQNNNYIRLSKMINMYSIEGSDPRTVGMFYAQSASLVGFMIKEHGSKRFVQFCREMRDGDSVEEALCSAYARSMPTLKHLEDKWKAYYAK